MKPTPPSRTFDLADVRARMDGLRGQQYWQSLEKLFAYSHDREGEHFPAWSAFNRRARDNDAVGIWHESYALTPDACENIYRDMPPFGLGGAIGVTSAIARMGGLRDPLKSG